MDSNEAKTNNANIDPELAALLTLGKALAEKSSDAPHASEEERRNKRAEVLAVLDALYSEED